MTENELVFVAALSRAIDEATSGHVAPLVPIAAAVAPELLALGQSVSRLLASVELLQRFSVALANGEIAFEAPPRVALLGPLKSLQASLRHLTWQTQEVAAGHLEHRVDFLGEFSAAFNLMIDALQMKHRAEHEAMEATRLAGVGQLAAGIAHEINTPLQYINTNLEYIGESLLAWQAMSRKILPGGDGAGHNATDPEQALRCLREELTEVKNNWPMEEMQAALDDTVDGTARIARIVAAVKKFTAVGGTTKVQVDINALIENTVEVSHNAWSHAAECVLLLAPDLPPIPCRADDINQVLLNLILNAAQAIEECGKPLPGKITVSTGREEERIVIRIADSGPGIPEKNRNQIFNLFFTTRDVGKGTGLGLALVHDVIVAKHGGSIEVGGQEGEGAVFTLRLPVTA